MFPTSNIALHYFTIIPQVAQYIGEMCRYILAVPPKPEDKQHKLRMIFGNGLRPQIWTAFVERFNISKVAEFYGATEGNANIGK
jgi:solute carrier family 27 fatty acid transporter 1/4